MSMEMIIAVSVMAVLFIVVSVLIPLGRAAEEEVTLQLDAAQRRGRDDLGARQVGLGVA